MSKATTAELILENLSARKDSPVAKMVHGLIQLIPHAHCRARLLSMMHTIVNDCEVSMEYTPCIKVINRTINDLFADTCDVSEPIISSEGILLVESDKLDNIIQYLSPSSYGIWGRNSSSTKKARNAIQTSIYSLVKELMQTIDIFNIENIEMHLPIIVFSRNNANVCIHLQSLLSYSANTQGSVGENELFDAAYSHLFGDHSKVLSMTTSLVKPPYEMTEDNMYILTILPTQYLFYECFEDGNAHSPSLKRKIK